MATEHIDSDGPALMDGETLVGSANPNHFDSLLASVLGESGANRIPSVRQPEPGRKFPDVGQQWGGVGTRRQ